MSGADEKMTTREADKDLKDQDSGMYLPLMLIGCMFFVYVMFIKATLAYPRHVIHVLSLRNQSPSPPDYSQRLPGRTPACLHASSVK